MPQNSKEEKKCMEKLNEMSRFLPFLDFMIEKVQKKSSEISLDSPLNKFKLLRSMIAEKKGKYTWKIIIEVEEVILKLISKLDYKDPYINSQKENSHSSREKTKHFSKKSTHLDKNNKMAAVVSIVPSSTTTTISVSNALSSPKVTTVDSRPQDTSTNTVDLIMKTLKLSANSRKKEYTENENCKDLSSSSLESFEHIKDKDDSSKNEKDKDNFESPKYSNPKVGKTNGPSAATCLVPNKPLSHNDLLSSSREKLLKSLQKKLPISKTDRPSLESSKLSKNDKGFYSDYDCSFSDVWNRNSSNDFNSKNGTLVSKHKKDNSGFDRHITKSSESTQEKNFSTASSKSFYFDSTFDKKSFNDGGNSLSNFSSKQKLREKLSADICEVHRVAGKSVGGSLRSLKDRRKSTAFEEDDLFKPDKIIETSRSNSAEFKESSKVQLEKPNKHFSGIERDERKNQFDVKKISHKRYSNCEGNSEDKREDRINKTCENKNEGNKKRLEDIKETKKSKNSDGENNENNKNDLNSLTDQELFQFVKENMQSLPHLSKLISFELSKTVRSTLVSNRYSGLSDISEDSFQDLDEFVTEENRTGNNKKNAKLLKKNKNQKEEDKNNPSSNLKISQDINDEIEKDVKLGVQPSKVIRESETNDDKISDYSSDESEFAEKLIEETTPRTFTKKKKGLLELPLPWSDDLFDRISSDESDEPSKYSNNSRDPRRKIVTQAQSNKSSPTYSRPEKKAFTSEYNRAPSDARLPSGNFINPPVAKDPIYSPIPPKNYNYQNLSIDSPDRMTKNIRDLDGYRVKEKNEFWNTHPVYIPQEKHPGPFSQVNFRYSSDTNDPKFQNVGIFPNQYPVSMYYADPLRHNSYNSSEPKSYAEYKRMKQKEQERLQQQEIELKDNAVENNSTEKNSITNDSIALPAITNEFIENISEKNIEIPLSKPEDALEGPRNSKNVILGTQEKLPVSKPREIIKRRYSEKAEQKCTSDIPKRRKSYFQETKKHEDEKKKNLFLEKRNSGQYNEIISPLGLLYQNENKPKTGRGYGLQNFKIPKINRDSVNLKKTDENQSSRNETSHSVKDVSQTGIQTAENENKNNCLKAIYLKKETVSNENIIEGSECKTTSNQTSENLKDSNETATDSPKTDPSDKEEKNSSAKNISMSENTSNINNEHKSNASDPPNTEITTDSKNPSTNENVLSIDSKEISVKKNSTVEGESDMKVEFENQNFSEGIKKYETEVVECDSSIGGTESTRLSNSVENKSTEPILIDDKSSTSSKNEITQEFVESLIKKCFQSGEGKLLLAQAKLFEKFTRKLNSKKIKTLKKIINSDSSSSSSSESSSEDEELTKSKNSEEIIKEKSLKKKKKRKKMRKNRTLHLSSSSESEENNDNIERKIEDKNKGNSKDNKAQNTKILATEKTSTDDKNESSDFTESKLRSKNKKKSKTTNSKKYSSQRTRQKKQDECLSKEVLNENSLEESKIESPTSGESKNEAERKNKPKAKSKPKSELDRLHEDIKSMFISSGVISAVGPRMCRILKESTGNTNNVDITKESVSAGEEKLKKKPSPKNSRGSSLESRNSSPISEKPSAQDQNKSKAGETVLEESKPNSEENSEENNENKPKSEKEKSLSEFGEILKRQPVVLLQRVDLNNFGYGVKVSENCISFSRLQGRNKALKGKSSTSFYQKLSSHFKQTTFLERNKRKFERMKHKKGFKSCRRKRLMEVIDKLPLKMAKMKHLQFNTQNDREKLGCYGRKKKVEVKKADVRSGDLLNYAFDRKLAVYPCKLCSYITKNIASHYKSAHPDSEVLISRLNKSEAKKAIADSKDKGYGLSEKEPLSSNTLENRVNKKSSSSTRYLCRMCNWLGTPDIISFLSHICSHTGEYRFKCPAEGCSVAMNNLDYLKSHISTVHFTKKAELLEKIIKVFPEPSEGTTLFGFICSDCNFLQLSRENVQKHVKKNHSFVKTTKIIKIDLCRKIENRSKYGKAEMTKKTRSFSGKINEKSVDSVGLNNEKSGHTVIVKSTEEIINRTVLCDLTEEENSDKAPHSRPNVRPLSDEHEESTTSSAENSLDIKCDEESLSENSDYCWDSDENVEIENCTTLKNASSVEVVYSQEESDVEELDKTTIEETSRSSDCPASIRVGLLLAKRLENSEVLYKCCVKNCFFSTTEYELFEKHVNIIHPKIKWNGCCGLCRGKSVAPFPSVRLISALEHLKQHESSKASQNENSEAKKIHENPFTEIGDLQNTVLLQKSKKTEEIVSKSEKIFKIENQEGLYPVKPLLRVRNFLGDRLSTPKDLLEANEVVDISEPEICKIDSNPHQKTDPVVMFTIENVRTLKPGEEDEEEENQLEIKQIGPNQEEPQKTNVRRRKPILVRSCPTRQIAILPDSGTFPVEVGHVENLKVVQSPLNAPTTLPNPHPVNTSLGIITIPKFKFSVQPVKVTTTSAFLNSDTVSVTYSTPPSIVASSSALSINVENNAGLGSTSEAPQANQNSAVSKTSGKISPKVPKKRSQPNSPILQRLQMNSVEGNKSVKDAKIYQEMLTKTKLCHLFKCMAVECSFTCNDQNVFTQHLGLHEAQMRMKNQKRLMKTVHSEGSNKINKIYNWKQCAYCCEVLSTKGSSLSQHILSEHGHCIYQCAFCFYRAVTDNYVKVHQNLAHTQILKNSSPVIYKCKPLSNGPSMTNALKEQLKKQNVRPYHCDRCGSNYYITQEFLNHLTTKHQGITGYTCHICKNLCFKADRLVVHYRLHSYCTYQCAYCLHGTETEKEMIFHLCNFHFSQPPNIYVRALAKGQNCDGSHLESLKMIVYEGEPVNPDCIIEAEPDEDTFNDVSETPESMDLSEIVAELGINEGNQTPVTPIIKELASLGKQGKDNFTVETLLPNATFSSEKECEDENCSVLISSRLNLPISEDSELDTPLSQLPVEPVIVQTSNSKPLNKSVHKLPAMILSQCSSRKVYAAKPLPQLKSMPNNKIKENFKSCQLVNSEVESKNEKENLNQNSQNLEPKEKTVKNPENINEVLHENMESQQTIVVQPLITNVVSLSEEASSTEQNVEKSKLQCDALIISDVCSLSDSSMKKAVDINSSLELVTNVQSKLNPSALKPPIIRVEDFSVVENQPKNFEKNVLPVISYNNSTEFVKNKTESVSKEKKEETEKTNEFGENDTNPSSPDIIILEETSRDNIETVTLDSDEEKEETTEKTKNTKNSDENILKEMEVLRNQITEETDCLLFDESGANEGSTQPTEKDIPPEPSKNSPSFEKVNCSLNKKLETESVKELKEKKECEANASPNKLRRTRYGFREKSKKSRNSESFEKSDNEESNLSSTASENRDEKSKNKKFKDGLSGTDLYLCGNDNCNFSTEVDALLKEHLYVCDHSRESSLMVCPHCSRSIKQFNAYVEHIKHHGKKNFICGLCKFATAVESSMIRHLKQKHKCIQFKKVTKDPSKEECTIYYPKNHKLEKQNFEEKGYSPGDEDKLPLQSVYQVNVKCAKCPYFTKVRSNMVRHLKIHLKSVETEGGVVVPSTAPTNPVPCLDTKEKMFDKMTNLAASSQLAQAKEKTAIEALTSEEKAKLPQFVAEQLRFKCCLSDCNYITVDEGMLKHHIKALHDEINYYSCPHCEETVHVDVRHVILDKIGHHLKYHDNKLYKCAYCIYFHYQKGAVEKHTTEKHPDRRYYVHIVREPKTEVSLDEEVPQIDKSTIFWKCGLCEEFQNSSKEMVTEHLLKSHNTRAKYQCGLCNVKSSNCHAYSSHFASKHPGEKVTVIRMLQKINGNNQQESQSCSSGTESSSEYFDTTPLWQRGVPRIRHIRGILIEEEEVKTKKRKIMTEDQESESDIPPAVGINNAFYCPLCSNKKKPFYTRNADSFKSHLYQELNYNQFACILCGKMFVEKKDFEKHHNRMHPHKPQSFKQTKEDGQIMFWVDKVIARQKSQMQTQKRKKEEENSNSLSECPPKKKKKSEAPVK